MSGYRKFKQKVYDMVEMRDKSNAWAIIYNVLLVTLIIASCCLVIIEMFIPDGYDQLITVLHIIEYAITACFILEYVMKLWLADLIYPELSPFKARIEFIISFESLIDIICVLSILLNQIPREVAVVKLLKLIKLVRIVKVAERTDNTDGKAGKMDNFKKRVHEIITKDTEGDKLSRLYDVFAIALICLSVVILFVETFDIGETTFSVLHGIEYGIAIIFLIEYVVRVWLAPQEYPKVRPDKARMKYIFSFMALIDLLSIVPVLIPSLPEGVAIVKILKFCKILRLVKASRYLSGIADFGKAVSSRRKQIFFSLVIMAVLLILCSFLMYTFEHSAQPDVYDSAFAGMLKSFSVLTGLGEESFEPVTAMGEVLSMIMSLLAVCVFAVPVTIVSDEFMNIVEAKNAVEDEEKEKDKEMEEDKEEDTESTIDISNLDDKSRALIKQMYDILKDKEE